MGRKKTNDSYKHFNYLKNEDVSICNLCQIKMKGRHTANLERHLRSKHETEYNTLRKRPNPNETGECSASKQKKLDEIIIQESIKVKLSRQTIIEACTDLVTLNGRPLKMLSDSGFKKIISPIFEAFGKNFSITEKNIQIYIAERAANIRNKIKNELQNKVICLKIDGATRMDRSILGINVQYIDKEKIVVRTLAMTEIKSKHTAEHLKNLLAQTLRNFNIQKIQIYSITTDNGSNMIKIVDLLQDSVENEQESDSEDQEESEENEMRNNLNNEDSALSLTMEELPNDFMDNTDQAITRQIRCAAHTLQLAVNDALKIQSSNINKARQVCKRLRTSTFLPLLKKFNHKKPLIDCPTRWNSTYDMLQCLLELRTFCIDFAPSNKDLHLSEIQWEFIASVVDSLKPAKEATIDLQKEQLTMGDFYGIWWKCLTMTKKIETPLARSLCESMTKRQKILFDNDAFVTALYLDPRFQCILTKENKEVAKNHLVKLWNVINNIKKNQTSISQTSSDNNSSESDKQSEDELEKMLKNKSQQNAGQSNKKKHSSQEEGIHIANIINSYDDIPRLHHNANVLKYWDEQKEGKHRELFYLSQVVLAVPATQVSVERSFSGLRYILSDLRTSLKEDVLENIMLIRGNVEKKD